MLSVYSDRTLIKPQSINIYRTTEHKHRCYLAVIANGVIFIFQLEIEFNLRFISITRAGNRNRDIRGIIPLWTADPACDCYVHDARKGRRFYFRKTRTNSSNRSMLGLRVFSKKSIVKFRSHKHSIPYSFFLGTPSGYLQVNLPVHIEPFPLPLAGRAFLFFSLPFPAHPKPPLRFPLLRGRGSALKDQEWDPAFRIAPKPAPPQLH
ncbi:hypothetical protein CGOTT_08420 [Corynebacterium gottingense]|nr:hypothetical protein CGOTT_08420 [Corynebacterium gottingense]WJZ15918.1 hypothetical protein CGOTTB_08385 [Corynebacterium gottingense]